MLSSRLLVTGATGFVGRFLAMRLQKDGYAVRGAVRRPLTGAVPFEPVVTGAVDGRTDWQPALEYVDTVIHLVARTHATVERYGDLAGYRRVNVDGTRKVAEQAAAVGVRRLVFVSSVKVNGERTTERPFNAADMPAPEDPYGMSKWEAEQALREVAACTGLETVIVRPPLIYGPGVKANFARLWSWVERGVPLPFAAVHNRRSLVALPNLIDLLVRCVEALEAPGKTFLVSDGEDVSTPGLVREMAVAMGKKPRLFAVPPSALRLVGRLSGRSAEVERLCGSLQVDIDDTRRVLDWQPPVTLQQALRQMVEQAW